jgi:CBS domain-containing protein
MTVRDILRQKGPALHSVHPEQCVHDAVQLMNTHHIGALLVLDADGKLLGIATERDILRECLHRAELLKQTKVGDIMTKNLIIGVLDDELNYVMGVLTKNRIRHLPIMDGQRVAGLISVVDLIKAALEEMEFENRYLLDYIQSR